MQLARSVLKREAFDQHSAHAGNTQRSTVNRQGRSHGTLSCSTVTQNAQQPQLIPCQRARLRHFSEYWDGRHLAKLAAAAKASQQPSIVAISPPHCAVRSGVILSSQFPASPSSQFPASLSSRAAARQCMSEHERGSTYNTMVR